MQLGMNIGGPFHREIALAISLLLSFVMGVWIALLYNATYRGLSFSKNFLHALVLSPIVLSIAMHAVGDHLARGIGMAGALSMVRFRSSLKDPRDMFFLFAAIAIGVA